MLTFNPGFFDDSQVNKIMEESIKMKHFDHPNVLHLIGVCLDAGPAPYVVMPYMANGSLLHYLKKERNNLVLPVGVDDDVVSHGHYMCPKIPNLYFKLVDCCNFRNVAVSLSRDRP